MAAPQRRTMYALIAGNQMCNYAVRLALPSLVQVASKELQLSDAAKAMLLSAHTPGYLLTQIPAGMLTQRLGAKRLLTLNTGGAAILLMLVPVAAVRGGARAMASTLAMMALFHGPMIPCQSELKRQWLPAGAERAWALRFISFGGKLASFTTTLTPWLCARVGWRGAVYVFGGTTLLFSAVWELIAANRPPHNDETNADSSASAPAGSKLHKQPADWRIFQVPSVQAVVLLHIACNNLWTVFNTNVFIYFDEVLGCSTVATGQWLALPPLVQLVGNFVVAGLESVMIGRGWSTLSIRKIVTIWGSLVSSAAICMFGCSRTALTATLWYCVALAGTCLHGSGWSANYLEVGGEDTALLNGVGNTIANLPSFVVPYLSLALRKRFGSFMPICLVAASLKVLAALVFARHGAVKPARMALGPRVAASR